MSLWKRIITFVVVFTVLLSCLVSPASAAFTETCWINLLDYYTGPLHGTSAYTFSLPSEMSLYNVDFLVRSSHAPTAANVDTPVGPFTLTCVSLGNGIYRLFGILSGHAHSAVVLHTGLESISGAWCSILSAEASMLTANSFDAPAVGYVSSSDGTYDISIDTDLSKVFALPAVKDGSDLSFTSDILCSDWEKYDYYVLTLQAYCNDITSVSVTQGSDVPPYTISPWENVNLQDNPYIITIRIDLRDVVRNSYDAPCVTICGNLYPISAGVNGFGILRAQGEIEFSDIDPAVHWLKKIWQSINDFFGGSKNNELSQAGEDMKNSASDINAAGDALGGSAQPDFDGGEIIGGLSDFDSVGLTIFSCITSNPMVTSMLVVVFTFCLAGYIFFGKRR